MTSEEEERRRFVLGGTRVNGLKSEGKRDMNFFDHSSSRLSPFPLSLGIPRQSLSCDAGRRLSESVAYPSPMPHHDLGIWRLVLCHRSSLLMVITQCIHKILHKHELITVYTFFVHVVAPVVFHVSEPYNITGLGEIGF